VQNSYGICVQSQHRLPHQYLTQLIHRPQGIGMAAWVDIMLLDKDCLMMGAGGVREWALYGA
jgi:hypothetical protein